MILLVEDNDEDYLAFERALANADVQRPVHRCHSGDDPVPTRTIRKSASDGRRSHSRSGSLAMSDSESIGW